MAQSEAELFRKVYFFRLEHFADIKDGLTLALERIAKLAFNDQERYKLDRLTGLRLSAYPDTASYPLKVRFCKIRRAALPEIEKGGALSPLALHEDEGLVDISHIIIFDDGFVAAEWNPDGPKLQTLESYIIEKSKLNFTPRFLALVERDIVEVIKSLSSVKLLEIDVPPEAAELARQADQSLYDAIVATTAAGATKKTGLELVAENPTTKLRDLAARLADLIRQRPQDGKLIKSLRVKGYKPGSKLGRYIDILDSKLVTGTFFPKTSERARSLKSHETYSIIEQLYEENRGRLETSAWTTDVL